MQYNFPEREKIQHVDHFISNVINTKTKKFKPSLQFKEKTESQH